MLIIKNIIVIHNLVKHNGKRNNYKVYYLLDDPLIIVTSKFSQWQD